MTRRAHRLIEAAVGGVPLFEKLELRTLLSAGGAIWHINGDRDGTASDDWIVVEVDPSNDKQFRATVNGEIVGTRDRDNIGGIEINGGLGNDDVEVNLGVDDQDIGVTLLGGAGDDTLSGGAGDDSLDGGSGLGCGPGRA